MDEERRADAEKAEDDGPRLPRRKLLLIVVPIVVLAVVGTATTAMTPYLASHHPLLLIIMEARNRNLILARRVDVVPFVLVASVRRMLTDPLYYLLGYHYGDRAVRWLEVKAGLGSYARLMERVFKKASYPAVFLFPGAIVCALAGVVRMRFATFMALNVAGTLAAVITLKAFGDVVASPVDAVVGFFDRNLLLTSVISVLLVVLSIWAGRVQGKAELSINDIDDLERGDFEGADEPLDVEERVEPDREAGPAGH